MGNKIGFFDLQPTKDGSGYIGALLVTDALGKPEEFRISYPVKPTTVQRALYGASLTPHVGINLCAAPLYHELSTRDELALIVLASSDYLSLSKYVQCRVVYLVRAGERLEVSDADGKHATTVQSPNAYFQPLSVTFPTDYDREATDETRRLVQSYSENIDLLEPFERIQKAVGALAESDNRFH